MSERNARVYVCIDSSVRQRKRGKERLSETAATRRSLIQRRELGTSRENKKSKRKLRRIERRRKKKKKKCFAGALSFSPINLFPSPQREGEDEEEREREKESVCVSVAVTVLTTSGFFSLSCMDGCLRVVIFLTSSTLLVS